MYRFIPSFGPAVLDFEMLTDPKELCRGNCNEGLPTAT